MSQALVWLFCFDTSEAGSNHSRRKPWLGLLARSQMLASRTSAGVRCPVPGANRKGRRPSTGFQGMLDHV